MKFGNFAREDSVTVGTGVLTLTQVSGFARLSDIFANGTTVTYAIKNGSNREVGLGTVGAGNTLARTSIETTLVAGVFDDTSPVAITLSGSSEVYVIVSAADLQSFDDHANSASNPHATSINNAADTVITSAAKGDLLVYNGTAYIEVAAGTNDYLLTADSGQPAGLKWAASAGGSPFTDLEFSLNLSRTTATLNGTTTDGHVNLGSGTSVTGTASQAYDFITISGGTGNSALKLYSTVGGGIANQATGTGTTISGGSTNTATTNYATVGGGNLNNSIGQYSLIAGGRQGNSNGNYTTICGGRYNTAGATYTTVMGGSYNDATANYAVAIGGRGNTASHLYSTAAGGGSQTRADFDFVLGATATSTASTANNTIRLQGTGGNIRIDGAVSSPEADIAEMFQWKDGNINDEDRTGFFVSLDKGRIVLGGQNIIGIISGTPSLISNDAPNNWGGMYIKDRYKRNKKAKYTRIEWIEKINGEEENREVYESADGSKLFDEYPQPTTKDGTVSNRKPPKNAKREVISVNIVNPAFDISLADSYKPRSERKEWGVVGVNGQIVVNTIEPITGWKVSVDRTTGMVRNAKGNSGQTYDVVEIIDDTTVLVYFK